MRESSKEKKIFISGASGFIGKNLTKYLQQHKYQVIGVSRDQLKLPVAELAKIFEDSYAVIHLAGAPIIKRWSKKYKNEIYNSRVLLTQNLSQAIALCQKKPKVFISNSAVGIYCNELPCTEEKNCHGEGFLTQVCVDWEQAAMSVAKETSVRTVIFRMGVVLQKDGGALKSMLLPFYFGMGGNIGSGKQIVSWIHMQDVLDAYLFVLENPQSQGIFNIAAPQAVNYEAIVHVLSSLLRRPSFFSVPAFAIKLLFGEAACVLLDSKHAIPQKLQEQGFVFQYLDIETALRNILQTK